jgi:spore germination cell wall hydrolase CwlJ-like protein
VLGLFFRKLLLVVLVLFFAISPAHAVPAWIDGLLPHSSLQQVPEANRREAACLALAIYFEARGEPIEGQRAVGHVLVNRTRSPRYPTTICAVLFQRGQFSFLRGTTPVLPRTASMWTTAIGVATAVMASSDDASRGALSFCSRRLKRTGYRIGGHVFYR